MQVKQRPPTINLSCPNASAKLSTLPIPFCKVKKDVFSINDSLLQFDNTTKKSYVEIQISGQKFERRDIELGISDGVYAEVLGGVTEKDNIKIWNKTEPLKRGDQDEQEYNYDN